MGELSHWIVTRFNVQNLPHSSIHLDETWIAERLTLMSRYTAPSVALVAEECHWMILCDRKTPSRWIDKIAEMPGKPEIALIDGVFTSEAVRLSLRARGFRSGLSTQLDSDDVLLDGWLNSVRESASQHGDGVYTSPIGYQLKEGRFYWRCYFQNPFLTCNSSEGRTVYDFDHFDLRNERFRIVSWKPAWAQIIHGGNLANDVRGIRIRGDAAAQKLSDTGIAVSESHERAAEWKREAVSTSLRYLGDSLYALPKVLGLFASRRR